MISIRMLARVSNQPVCRTEENQRGEAFCHWKMIVKLAIFGEAEIRALCLDGSFDEQVDVGLGFRFRSHLGFVNTQRPAERQGRFLRPPRLRFGLP